ncbi:putative F-box protein At3g58860 [Coffea eugenioides]|uniref:putative F-box protein At3g58860 n=1 Tax=Coffea eugenioides TaxID=49369 RepID=UPI000F612C02|nr:putative F-box protein At3g58860 [Coffea eugenioides]
MESGNEVRTRTILDDVSLGNFSRLPGSMIHHMCSFLYARDVARTSILSKSWYCVSAIYSNITFHFTYEKSKLEDLFERGFPDGRFRQQVQRKKLDFLVQTDKSIRTRLEREANVLRFYLHIDFPNLNLLAPGIDGWISLALKKNIKELVLCVDCLNRIRSYYNATQFVSLASCLKVLSLGYCTFESNLDIKLPQLQRISLRDSCFAGRSLFERFLCGCPVIEYVKIWFCKIDEHLSIPNLPRLEYLSV